MKNIAERQDRKSKREPQTDTHSLYNEVRLRNERKQQDTALNNVQSNLTNKH